MSTEDRMSRRPADPHRPLPEGAHELPDDPTDERPPLLQGPPLEPGAWEMDSLDADTVEIPVLDMPELLGPEIPEVAGHARKKTPNAD